MKKINDFSQYTNILPYASEIFGVYKPLLGWKSKKIRERMEEGFANDINRVFSSLYGNFKSQFEIALNEDRSLQEIKFVEPASIDAPEPGLTGSYVIDSIASELPPLSAYKDDVWDHVIQAGRLTNTLTTVIVPRCMEWYQATGEQHHRTGRGQDDVLNNRMGADQLNRESVISGYLLYLKANNQLDQLKDIFYK